MLNGVASEKNSSSTFS